MKTIFTLIATVLTLSVTAQKANPLIGSVSISQPTCYGYSDGYITINPYGGLPPYRFLWSTGDTTQTISNLTAGNYSVIVTDAVQQTMEGILVLPEPSQITVSGTNTDTQFGTYNGSIDITSINGGAGGYTWNWTSNNGMPMNQSSLDQTGLKAGNYKIIVTDQNGCQGIGYYAINSTLNPLSNPAFKVKPISNSTTAISTYPNPSNGSFTLEPKELVDQIRIVNTITGEEVYSENSPSSKLQITNLKTGVYMIYVSTEKGTEVERITVL